MKFGRKPKLTAEQQAYVAKLRADGEGVRQIARIMSVSSATIGRIPAAEEGRPAPGAKVRWR